MSDSFLTEDSTLRLPEPGGRESGERVLEMSREGGGGIIAGMVLTVYNLFMCIYVEEDSRKTST